MEKKCTIWKMDGYKPWAGHQGTCRSYYLFNAKTGEPFDAAKVSKVLVGLWCTESVQPLHAHKHHSEEWWYVLEGKGIMQIEGQEDVEIGPGDIVYTPPDVVHSFRPLDRSVCRFLAFATPIALSEEEMKKSVEDNEKMASVEDYRVPFV